jgi:signal transduction histidine kinase
VNPYAWDALVAVGVFAFIVLSELWFFVPHDQRGVDAPMGWALIVLACAPLAWRRRTPITTLTLTAIAAVAYGAQGYTGDFIGLAFVVALYTAAAYRDRGSVIAAVLPIAIVATVAIYRSGPNPVERWADVAFNTALLVGVPIAFGRFEFNRRRRIERDRDRVTDDAVAEERARIAREMHDVLAHKMSLIALHAAALELDHTSDPSRVGEAATLIGATAREALDELRSVLGLLRSSGEVSGDTASGGEESGGEMSGASGLRDQFADIGLLVTSWEQAGVQVELRDTVGQMPTTIGRAAYRLVQEGLTNAHRHATGAAVVVTITGGHGHDVVVSVVNGAADGGSRASRSSGPRGLAALPGSGTGLVGLGERLRLVGGTLVAEHHDAGGWKLEGRLPWPDDAPGVRRHGPVDGASRDQGPAGG